MNEQQPRKGRNPLPEDEKRVKTVLFVKAGARRGKTNAQMVELIEGTNSAIISSIKSDIKSSTEIEQAKEIERLKRLLDAKPELDKVYAPEYSNDNEKQACDIALAGIRKATNKSMALSRLVTWSKSV